jgi:hypothetical protein
MLRRGVAELSGFVLTSPRIPRSQGMLRMALVKVKRGIVPKTWSPQ